ncbi:DNA adenine methylase [Sulfobacillus sp. hq2]|uniref:DNA adenine methylase n=1 Tax=Sulfobacillus TaxID=28033 RepID=UPI000CD1DD6A|nr:DNA adenine methylase [Sulfobacillus sp. hq2]POB12047.1 DNA methyltransferase [Sulfobacillus sp. hq2]
MSKNKMVRPFLKWAGGKRQLLPELRRYYPKNFHRYYEPFVGAGAVLFDLQPLQAVVNDMNSELINTYRVVANDVEALIANMAKHHNDKEYYYQLRGLDRTAQYRELTDVERASRIIFLNKTCFNGLFRVNSHGHFNVPFGHYKNPTIIDETALRATSQYLSSNGISLTNMDFEQALQGATKGDFVYLDPPYDPISDTASFTAYDRGGFDRNQQIRLKSVFDDLNRRGCHVLLSNSATAFIKDLYRDYPMQIIGANRAINSDAKHRGKIDEVLVMNYDTSANAVGSRL